MNLYKYSVLLVATLSAVLLYADVDAAEDHYKTLRVKRTATDKEIKRAFRKLALKYHPDKNKDKDAEAKFLKIGKAYEILSDPEKRKKYDMYGDDGTGPEANTGGFQNGDFNQFFKQFDEAMNSHRNGHHYNHHGGNGGFRHFNTFGDSGSFFDFDNLFHDTDQDDLFGSYQGSRRSNGFRNHFGFNGGNFGHMFDNFFDGGNKYDRAHNSGDHFANHHHMHNNFHHNMHHNMHHQQFSQQRQQRCHQVTQRVGNQVITFTQCS